MFLLLNILINIIKKFDFELDNTDIKYLKLQYIKFYNLSKSLKRRHLNLSIIKHSVYYFYLYYQNINELYIEDILINFLICFLLANKYIEDDSLYNNEICSKFHLNLKTFNNMEVDLIKSLNYNVHIQENNLKNFVSEMYENLQIFI
jgi:hypothetical protein